MTLPVANTGRTFFLKKEASYGTPQAVVAGDGVALAEVELTPKRELVKSEESVQGPDLVDVVGALVSGEWSLKGYARAHTSGSACDLTALLECARFSRSGSTYTMDVTNGPSSLQITKHLDPQLQLVALGAWVDELQISCADKKIPEVNAKGGFSTYGGLVGSVTVNGAHTAPDTTILINEAYRIAKGALIKFGSEDNSGAGYLVTGVSSDGLTVTISPTLANNISNGAAVTALFPTPTVVGTLTNGIEHSLTIGATEVGLVSGSMKFTPGTKPLDKEISTDRASGVFGGKWEVAYEFTVYLKSENVDFLRHGWSDTPTAVSWRLGSATSGQHWTISSVAVRWEVSKIDTPADDVAMYKLTGFAIRGSNPGDLLTIATG